MKMKNDAGKFKSFAEKRTWHCGLWCRKAVILVLGVFMMSFGGVFCVKSQIGLAPATVVPYVLSCVFPFSFGTFTAVMNVMLVLLQVIILRRNFKVWQCLQFAVAVLFGVAVDVGTWALQGLQVTTYIGKWICSIFGAVLIALGIALEILSESVPAPADSAVRVISQASGRSFAFVKTAYDCALVAVAIVISRVALGNITAVREGTLFLAFFTGMMVKWMMQRLIFIKKFST